MNGKTKEEEFQRQRNRGRSRKIDNTCIKKNIEKSREVTDNTECRIINKNLKMVVQISVLD